MLTQILYEVSPNDPFALIISSLLLAAASLLACFFPARRATKVSPNDRLADGVVLLRIRPFERRHLGLKFFLALLQGLKTELPAVELDTELVDIASYFRALGFVLFELVL